MQKETQIKLKIVLTLASSGYSVNGAKRWLREKGEGIGEGCYYKYSRVFVDLPLEELNGVPAIRLKRLNFWEILNPIAVIELEEECEAKAEELLKALRGMKRVGEKEEAEAS